MSQNFSTNLQQGNGKRLCCLICCLMLFILMTGSLPSLAEEEDASSEKVVVSGLTASPSGKNLQIVIHSSAKFNVLPLRLTNPIRIVVDITNGEIQSGVELVLPEAYRIKVRQDWFPAVSQRRIEFILPQDYTFTSTWNENDLVLIIENFFVEEQAATDEKESDPVAQTEESSELSQENQEADPPEKEVALESIDNRLVKVDVMGSVSEEGGKSFEREGKGNPGQTSPIGDNDTISVDFYKIDIHNVFRMLREITGKNIVIAGSVSGNLTLALTDVPWRFALDIILNLKDLEKMERGNTIIIYPKGKEFVWPKQENENIDIKVNTDIVEAQKKEGITITGVNNIPPEQLEAKKMIANGRVAEKKGDLETAIRFYEKALNNWPENTKLATKISTTYLTKLNQNAKAVFYAKKALEVDKKNSAAALNAAIGYANMEEYRQAQQYFDQSVNSGEPSREALMSYAAFSERQRQYDAALRLLKKLEELYGQDLNSMVAQARIYDSLGDYSAARQKYKTILNAGFRVPPDLKKFILSKTGGN
ncbi:MAG: hypothetical protein Q3M24_09870 [Candidatus Electrothrix aestuarii]|uniref:Secretin/TonB short N-terminal domain-containing protein n=1 Tax=Candidatus Electrothrix aestuarii TaxID=3062594 RepID=A0AAU8M199_9BACT|nr:hypothetical protein [Candidatus Electrothrix aestuarii]